MSRSTPQRQAILHYLRSTRAHPTAQMVHDEVRQVLPRLALGTVYRNLDRLVEEGKVLRLEADPCRYDGQVQPHHHARCRACGELVDLFHLHPTGLEARAEAESGFLVDEIQVMVLGLCPRCQAEGHRPSRSHDPLNPNDTQEGDPTCRS